MTNPYAERCRQLRLAEQYRGRPVPFGHRRDLTTDEQNEIARKALTNLALFIGVKISIFMLIRKLGTWAAKQQQQEA